MRTAELAFLLILVLYHAFLILPRVRRLFPTNYLIFLAGMALAWNLGLEGLRWQTIPPLILFLVDLAVLFPTFRTLRGKEPAPGIGPALARGLRTLVASMALFVAVGSVVLALAFPLPGVELSGGLTPGLRIVRFPATDGLPGVELHLWYPASGDGRPLPRPQAEPPYWRQVRVAGGLPVFWQAYQAYLPSNLIMGGKLTSKDNRYPVVYAAFPKGQNPEDFGYLFEDLASRGFLVAAATQIPGSSGSPDPFSWDTAFAEITDPFKSPESLLEPDRSLALSNQPTDFGSLTAAKKALRQLDRQPGDFLFSSVDWVNQGLWAWGPGSGISPQLADDLGITCLIHAGGTTPRVPATHLEFWISPKAPTTAVPQGRWILEWPGFGRADLADSAYLKPFLAFFALKTQADSGYHEVLRQYQAAFFQYAFWSSKKDSSFARTVPVVPGLQLSGQ